VASQRGCLTIPGTCGSGERSLTVAAQEPSASTAIPERICGWTHGRKMQGMKETKGFPRSGGRTRRQVLAAMAAGTGAFGKSRYGPRIVSNVTIWVQEFARRKQKDPAAGEDWEEAFGAIRAAGYRRVELLPQMVQGGRRDETARLLKKYGLLFNDVYFVGPMYSEEGAEKTIAGAIEMARRVAEFKTPILLFEMSTKPGRARPEDEELRIEARSLDRLGRAMQAHGMRIAVHNHTTPMKEGAREWLYVLRNTDPKLVSFCLDLDWSWQAGTDPLPLLYEAGEQGRLAMIHLRTQKQRVWTEALEDGGDIDFRKVAAFFRKTGFDGCLVVEIEYPYEELSAELIPKTKITRTVAENIRVSRIWAERVFGVSAQA
jgi:sugar phosphate isomerase/epimerase